MQALVAPKGATYEQTFDGFSIGCSTRSAEAFILVPFTLVWSGLSLGGIYGSQIVKGEFNPFMSFFGIIFLTGSGFLLSRTLMSIWGEVTFELRDGVLYYFVGIAPFGKKKSFAWRSIEEAREEVSSWDKHGKARHAIYLEGAERHVVGQALSAQHRYFVVRVLNEQLQRRKG